MTTSMPLAPLFGSPLLPASGSIVAVDALALDVRAAQGGDVRAFERLYRAHVGRVYALCLRLSADPVRAEQLTQDSFVRAWENLSSYREGAFGAWLRKLAVNVALAELRSQVRREKRVALAGDDTVDAPSPPRDHGERLDLERAIAALPEGARAVFVLHDVEGYGHEEIAEIVGIAEGTSKAHLHKARAKLKEMLR